MKRWVKYLIWHGVVSVVECVDHRYAWSGAMPCTGVYRCVFCGKTRDDL